MIKELQCALRDAVNSAIPVKDLAIAFSGGVDSTLLSIICRDLGKNVTLLTVGFTGSHDISFSKEIASKIDMTHRLVELEPRTFQVDLEHVQKTVTCGNTSHIENCIAYYYIAKTARSHDLDMVATANGFDELFCGYDGYRAVYAKGEPAIFEYMDSKIKNELLLVQEISAIAAEFSVQVRQPFLSGKFVDFAKNKIPLNQKIRGKNDMMRKHILRQAAISMGVPTDSALKPKKALQYGSQIHKNYKKLSAITKKEKMRN